MAEQKADADASENDTKPKDFEQALEMLENIVKELEGGELTLEASLARYEQGVGLARFCASKLDEAEKRIEVLRVDEAGDAKRDATGAVQRRALDVDVDVNAGNPSDDDR